MLNMQFRTSQYQVLILALLFVAVVQTRRVIRAAPGIETTGQYMVVLKPDTSHEKFEAIAEKVQSHSLSSGIHKIEGQFAKVITTKLSVDEAHKIKDLDNVEFLEEETFAEPSLSWALDRIDQVSPELDGMFEPGCDGEGVDIYILDTGINYNHSEFDNNRALYIGYDPADKYYGTNQTGSDCHGHGTHVASLACGKLHGVAKKANCYSVRVLNCSSSAPWSVIIDGLNSAATNITTMNPRRPAIISMSLIGGISYAVNNVTSTIVNMGIPIVAGAGNDKDDACNYSPASAPDVITVASSARGDNVSYFTNGGSCVDIFAPGSDVIGADYSCSEYTCTITRSGTSIATPIVSGAIALYLQEQPLLSPSQIMEKLLEDCLMSVLNFNGLPYNLQDTSPNCLLHINRTNCTTPQPSTSSALISSRTSLVVTSFLIDTVTPTESTTLDTTITPLPPVPSITPHQESSSSVFTSSSIIGIPPPTTITPSLPLTSTISHPGSSSFFLTSSSIIAIPPPTTITPSLPLTSTISHPGSSSFFLTSSSIIAIPPQTTITPSLPLTSTISHPGSSLFVLTSSDIIGIPPPTTITPSLPLSSSSSVFTSSSIIVTTTSTDITVTPSPTPPTIQGSCSKLNLSYCGCCKWSLSSQCYNNGCYCDECCHNYNDCCSDIADIDCYSNIYTDTEPISITNEDN